MTPTARHISLRLTTLVKGFFLSAAFLGNLSSTARLIAQEMAPLPHSTESEPATDERIPGGGGRSIALLPGAAVGSSDATEVRADMPLYYAQPTVVREPRTQTISSSFSFSSGYDTAVANIPHLAAMVTLGEAYFGIQIRKPRYVLMMTHDAKLARSFNTDTSTQQYQLTSVAFSGEESHLTNWSLALQNGYGTDSARLLGSVSSTNLDTATVPESTTAALGLVSGDTLSDHASFNVEHRVSVARTVSLGAGAFFHHFSATGLSDQQYNLNVGVRQRLSERQTVGLEAQAVNQHYQNTGCTTSSVAFTDAVQFSRSFRLEAMAGPVWGSSSCTGTYIYSGLLTIASARGGLVYLGSGRQRSSGFVNQSTIEKSTFAGFAAGQPIRLQTRVDAGYAEYTLSNAQSSSLRGYFVSGEVRHRFSQFAEISFVARYFSSASGPQQLNRALVLATYTWSREQRPSRVLLQRGYQNGR